MYCLPSHITNTYADLTVKNSTTFKLCLVHVFLFMIRALPAHDSHGYSSGKHRNPAADGVGLHTIRPIARFRVIMCLLAV